MGDDPIPALKRQLARDLTRVIDGWETTELCYFLRTDQPTVSRLRAGRVDRFSIERLIRWLARMDVAVDLTVREVRVGRPRGRREDW